MGACLDGMAGKDVPRPEPGSSTGRMSNPSAVPMWNLIRFKHLAGLCALVAMGAEGARASELPTRPRVSEETMTKLRRLSDAYMLDFSIGEYSRATKRLGRALGLNEGIEDEAERLEQLFLARDPLGFGGSPIDGRFLFVGSSEIGNRKIKFIYLDQRSLGSCVVVISFIKPGDSWLARFAFGSAGAGADLKPFWVVDEPKTLAQVIPDLPKLLESTQDCMRGITAGEGRRALDALLDRHGSKWPPTFREKVMSSAITSLEHPPDAFGKPIDYEFLGACRIANQELRIVYLWHFQKDNFHRRIPVSFGFSRIGDSWHYKHLTIGEAADDDMHIFTTNITDMAPEDDPVREE